MDKLKRLFHDYKMRRKAEARLFDPHSYRIRYRDLVDMSDAELRKHWIKFGFKEGRNAAPLDMDPVRPAEHEADEASCAFDPHFYLSINPKLAKQGVSTPEQALEHYKAKGRADNRVPSFAAWLKLRGLSIGMFPEGFSWKGMLGLEANKQLGLTPTMVFRVISGETLQPLHFCADAANNAATYVRLARSHLSQGRQDKGMNLLRLSCLFQPSTQALELLGNQHLERKLFRLAADYYTGALELGQGSKWLYVNRAKCLSHLQEMRQAIESICAGIERYPAWTHAFDQVDVLCDHLWNQYRELANKFNDVGDREHHRQAAYEYASAAHQALLRTHGVAEIPPLGPINLDKILIVGDFGLKQCHHYRVEQKIEQLEAAGARVTAVNWTKLSEHMAEVAEHDVVIFYRVQATPQILRAMAQVNAAGRLSLYEIDDLLFVPDYPPPLESYGGLVDLGQYHGLINGMCLMYAAARHCRFAIASTLPLAQELSQVVFAGKTLLHRNGLDHHLFLPVPARRSVERVNIFYGSGTKAHNTEFVDLALPALRRVLNEFPNAQFTVVGYLALPKDFLEAFGKRVTQHPLTSSLAAYYSLLQGADINLAVLLDDRVTGCKSEIKWLEAGWFGVPSVVSSTANYRDVILDGSDALMATDPESWYQALKKLVADPELRKEIGRAAAERVRMDYGMERMGQDLLEDLARLANPQAEADEEADEAPPLAKRRTKLAFVNVFFAPQSVGGATRVMEDNISVLRERYADEFDLCVFTTDAECREPHQLSVIMHQGLRVYRATVRFREHNDWHPTEPKMGELFQRFLDTERPDLIHFHCMQRLTGSVLEAAIKARVPYVVTVHDAWWISDYQFLVDRKGNVYLEGHPEGSDRPLPLPGISHGESVKRRHYLKDLLLLATQVFTVSEAFAGIYRKNGVPNVEVTRNGISTAVAWAPKDTAYTPNVVCALIGEKAPHKGYNILRQAVLDTQPKGLEFLIVDSTLEERQSHLVYWGEVPVTLIGRVSQARVVDLYRRIDVLFAPSTWPESFGLVTREAAACRCWVVASSLGGIGEDVVEGENGHRIEPTEEALREVLARIAADPARYKGLPAEMPVRTCAEQVSQLVEHYRRDVELSREYAASRRRRRRR